VKKRAPFQEKDRENGHTVCVNLLETIEVMNRVKDSILEREFASYPRKENLRSGAFGNTTLEDVMARNRISE